MATKIWLVRRICVALHLPGTTTKFSRTHFPVQESAASVLMALPQKRHKMEILPRPRPGLTATDGAFSFLGGNNPNVNYIEPYRSACDCSFTGSGPWQGFVRHAAHAIPLVRRCVWRNIGRRILSARSSSFGRCETARRSGPCCLIAPDQLRELANHLGNFFILILTRKTHAADHPQAASPNCRNCVG